MAAGDMRASLTPRDQRRYDSEIKAVLRAKYDIVEAHAPGLSTAEKTPVIMELASREIAAIRDRYCEKAAARRVRFWIGAKGYTLVGKRVMDRASLTDEDRATICAARVGRRQAERKAAAEAAN